MPEDIIVYGHAINIDEKKIYIMYKITNGDWPPTMIDVKYSKELKETLKQGTKQSEGKPFRLKKNGKSEQGDGQGEGREGDGSEGAEDGGGSLSNQSDTWEIMPLPPPRLPDK